MTSSFVVEAVRACVEDVYLVGGAVRDSLLGESEKIKDYDFATPLALESVIKSLEESNYRVLKHSVKHGTVTAYIGKTKIEISTFRKEEYVGSSSGDPSKIEFGSTLEEDLNRRDFTINAIAHDGESYIDPFDGQSDIINKKIRAVGNASQRFEEDPLRMVRALRFVSELGFSLTPDTYDAIVKLSPLIKEVSRARLTQEVGLLLTGRNWTRALSLGFESGLLEVILDVNLSDDSITMLLEDISHAQQVSDSLLSRWAALLISIVHSSSKLRHNQTQRGVLIEYFDKFRQVFEWSSKFEDSLHDKVSSVIAEEDYNSLIKQYEQLVVHNDTRQHIVHEKLLRIKLRQEISERNLSKVHKTAKKLINVQKLNFSSRVSRGEDESDVIKEFRDYLLSSVRLVYLKLVDEAGFIDNGVTFNKVFRNLISIQDTFSLLPFSVSNNEKMRIIEESIGFANEILNGRITNLTYAERLDKNTLIYRSKERLSKIYSAYVRELILLRKPPYLEDTIQKRAFFNYRAAQVLYELHDSKETQEYYSYLVDYYKWMALSSSDLDKFMNAYDEMNRLLDVIQNNPKFRYTYNQASEYLYNAQCLSYAVTLTNDLETKIEFVRNILGSYKQIKYGKSTRNIDRYRLLLEWLEVTKLLLENDFSYSKHVLASIPSLRSYHYKDVDEAYIRETLKEIDKVRTNFYDIEAFLSLLHGVDTEIVLVNESFKSIIGLHVSKNIDDELAYAIFKNVLTRLVLERVPLEPIYLLRGTEDIEKNSVSENIELIRNGESELVEFKESWRYDVKLKKLDNIGYVLDSAMKSIAAFMNTKGGKLFLGIDDSGTINGLEESDFIQFKRYGKQLAKQDALKKIIDDQIGRAIGSAHMTLVSVKFEMFGEKTFCIINVEQSPVNIFYNDKFYIRNSASTRELNLREYSEYLKLKSGD